MKNLFPPLYPDTKRAEESINDFKYTSCDNTTCKEHLNCKRYKMFTMGATDTKKGSGNAKEECERFLALKSK